MSKQTIIAVVGPDMCGKTEITKALSRVLGIPRFKASSEHDTYLNHQDRFINQLRYADTRMVDFLKQTRCSVIMDRAWPCEWAYSRVFQRETDRQVLSQVDEAMAELGAKIIICSRSSYAGIVDDIDPTTKEARLKSLDLEYRAFEGWTLCDVHILHVDDENLQREVTEILRFMGYAAPTVASMVSDLPRKP